MSGSERVKEHGVEIEVWQQVEIGEKTGKVFVSACNLLRVLRALRGEFPLHFCSSGLFVADFDLFVAFFYFFLCVLERRPYQN